MIESGSGSDTSRTTIEYNDDNQLRMNMSTDDDNYMLLRDSKVYAVMQQSGSQPTVMDVGAMMSLLGGAFGESMKGAQAAPEDMKTFISLKDTGEDETIAGIRGDVHTLRYRDGNGNERTEIVVLTSNRKVREMTEMMGELGRHIAQAVGGDTAASGEDFYENLYSQRSGILRMGNDFRLIEIDSRAPSNKRFDLPATPTAMPNFGNIFGGQPTQQPRGQAPATPAETPSAEQSNELGELVDEKADRQKNRVENKVDDAVDDATDRTVDKVLDRVLDGIFGT